MTSVMSTNVAGLGSEAIQGMAAMAATGNMSAGMMGDMMQQDWLTKVQWLQWEQKVWQV